MFKKVMVIVLDSFGVGALPDADEYGDAGSATYQHILDNYNTLSLPNMEALGLKELIGLGGHSRGVCCKARELSSGKDSIVGHWELMGSVTDKPFLTFPNGFPKEVMDKFNAITGTGCLGNVVASGTEIVERLGDEHVRTGYPIVYTSADSVFQIAAHEDVVPVETLYDWCAKTREMFDSWMGIGRVIARPFVGTSGSYARTPRRHDYAALPSSVTVPQLLEKQGIPVVAVGKTFDIFSGIGFSESNPTTGNTDGIQKAVDFAKSKEGFIFVNLVDYDMVYGHRRDVPGYATALEEFDRALPDIMAGLGNDGLLIITADHGCDPTYTGTDHTREYIPILIWHQGLKASNAGERETFADVGATVMKAFGLEAPFGKSII